VGEGGWKVGAVWDRDGCMLVGMDGNEGRQEVSLVEETRGQERGIAGQGRHCVLVETG
jgi:hypothetical protein